MAANEVWFAVDHLGGAGRSAVRADQEVNLLYEEWLSLLCCETMFQWIRDLHSSQGIIQLVETGGLLSLILIIFAETGLLAGFFLPGDSLLITAGVLANPANPQYLPFLRIAELNVLLIIAAVVGDQLGFVLGKKAGDRVWGRPDGFFFKKSHLQAAQEFYERYGGLSVVGARYVPVLRTFVPFAAGMARMPYRRFVFWNISGGILWVSSLLWAGFFLGQTRLADRLDKVIVIVILVSVAPLIAGTLKRFVFSRP